LFGFFVTSEQNVTFCVVMWVSEGQCLKNDLALGLAMGEDQAHFNAYN
jgi:hypothetical protein